MKTRYVFNVGVLVFCVANLMVPAIFAQAARRPPESDGAVVNGLHISLLPVRGTDESEEHPAFRVELHNAGDDDLILNLGMMLANGRRQYPDAITLLLTYPSGKEHRLVLLGPALVAGRMDPLVVPLPVDASFSIPVDLRKFAPFGQDQPKLEPGTYVLQAQFQGKAAIDSNLDMKGIALMPYWNGTVVSNPELLYIQ